MLFNFQSLEVNHSISDMSNQFNIATQKSNKTNLPMIDILSDADKTSFASVATDEPQKIQILEEFKLDNEQ